MKGAPSWCIMTVTWCNLARATIASLPAYVPSFFRFCTGKKILKIKHHQLIDWLINWEIWGLMPVQRYLSHTWNIASVYLCCVMTIILLTCHSDSMAHNSPKLFRPIEVLKWLKYARCIAPPMTMMCLKQNFYFSCKKPQ